MPSLSFDDIDEKGQAVARVKGGQFNGEILYLHDDSLGARKPKYAFNRTKYGKELKELKPLERTRAFARIEKALQLDEDEIKDEPPVVRALYNRVKEEAKESKEIELDDDGLFELLPNPDPKKREVWYVCGQSGSGKSWIAKQYAEMYHKLFPSRGIYLISKLDKDETLDALKFIKRIPIKSFVDDYPTLEEFKDSLTLWDDYDTLTGDYEKVVLKIIDDLAIMGRHQNVSMMCLSHYLTNYKKTRLILNEATNIVVYPQSTAYHPLKHLLVNYVGVEEDDLKRWRKLGSRWLQFKKGFPSIMISQRTAEILHQS
jgi:hypothetical protein